MNDMSTAGMQRAIIRRAEGRAFFNLSQTQRRISWDYRRWAMQEFQTNGKTECYEKWAAEARRLWRDALDHLALARRHLHG